MADDFSSLVSASVTVCSVLTKRGRESPAHKVANSRELKLNEIETAGVLVAASLFSGTTSCDEVK